MSKVVERFLEYVKYDTKSDENSNTVPTTAKQKVLGERLVNELKEIGLENVHMDENGYVMGELPANCEKEVPVIGFIAHMDTAPDMSGENVNPKIVEKYDGGDIILNAENNIVLSPREFPDLNDYIGQDLITTDGTTLLGADDKAGIAEIVTAVEYLRANPEIKHGKIMVGFTPDEEVGRGADHFDVEKFGADFAYTIDGGFVGELQFENFNAAGAKIKINGRNVHPGGAKDKMINSMFIASKFVQEFPVEQRPETTTGREGFFHLVGFQGEVEDTKLQYIIREHDFEKFDAMKTFMKDVVDRYNKEHGEGTVELTIVDQYKNMKEKIEPMMHIVDNAAKAMEEVDVEPKILPVRGGTDGARLSFMGLPTPNIFTGGHNFHGKYEYIPMRSMEKAVDVILKIVEIYTR